MNEYLYGDIHLHNSNKNNKVDIYVDSVNKDIKIHAPIECTSTVSTSVAPTLGDHLTNKTYVDATTGLSTLQEVCVNGNTTSTKLRVTNTTESTSTTTGALIVSGGVGVSKNVSIGGSLILNDYTLPDGHVIGDLLSTGLLSGGELSVFSGTQISITDGDGIISDTTVPADPVTTEVSWSGLTGITIDTLSSLFTYIYITSAGTVLQSLVEPTPILRRDNVFIGKVFTNGINVTAVNNQPDALDNSTDQTLDFFRGLGPVVLFGLRARSNGSNLSIDITAGSLHQTGINFHTTVQQPNVRDYVVDTLASISRSTQLTVAIPTTTLDPGNYDNGGVVTSIPGSSNRATNMRVYFFNSGFVSVQYGQQWYQSLAEAAAGVVIESFVVEPLTLANAVLIAVISIRSGATDLSLSTDAVFFSASKFGEINIGPGGTSTTSLQNAYNNSTQPQIILNSSDGGLQVQDAATPIAAPLFEVLDSGGSEIVSVDADGITLVKGTVTQITSSTTTVIINFKAGTITTFSATVASDSSITFTVTNSTVLTTSVVVASVADYAGSTGIPQASVDNIGSGSFDVVLSNVGTGNLNGVVKIQFIVV